MIDESWIKGVSAEDARRVLSFKDLAWFLCHHGFEQRWKICVRNLEASGDHELAAEIKAGGEIYDHWEAIRTSRYEGNLTREEESVYVAEMHPHVQRTWEIVKG